MSKLQMIFAMNENAFKIFYTIIFINMSITKRCTQDLINAVGFLQLLRPINLNLSEILLQQLKLRTIIDQTGTYIHKASKAVARYVGPRTTIDYTIRGTLGFPDLLKSALYHDNYEDVFLFLFFFFFLGFLLQTFTNHRAAEEGGGYFFNSSLPLPPA